MTPRPNVTLYVRNQSSRHGVKPTLIVIHDTEGGNVKGTADLVGVGRWFDNPAAQASAHVCNDAEGNDARYVPDERKAWHCAAYNSQSLGIEQIGRASQSEWPDAQIKNTAEWVAYWSAKYGIPIRRGAVSNGVVTRSGVLRHMDLGREGGGHSDPGVNYPFTRMLTLAKVIHKAQAPPTPVAKWKRSLRILRAKAAAYGWKLPYRVRARALKRQIVKAGVKNP